MARNGRTKVICKGTFISDRSLTLYPSMNLVSVVWNLTYNIFYILNPLIICLIKEHLQSSYEWMRPFSYEDCCHLSNLKNIVTPIKEFPFGLAGYLVKKSNNLQSIYNTILVHWFVGTNDSSTKRLMFQVSFFFIISCKTLWKNCLNFYFFILFKNKDKKF